MISEIIGHEVILIDPAVSSSLILKEILSQKGILKESGKCEENYYTTGFPEKVEKIAKIILNDNKKWVKIGVRPTLDTLKIRNFK